MSTALPFAKVLERLVPNAVETLFVRACVDPGPAGQAAWQAWRMRHSLQAGVAQGIAYKHLLPVLAHALEQGGRKLDAAERSYLRAARLREQNRSGRYHAILKRALTALAANNVPVLLLKGPVLAATVFPARELRHCHDIDLFARRADLERAESILVGEGFRPSPPAAAEPERALVHASSLPLELHTGLLGEPAYDAAMPDPWAGAVSVPDLSARTLAPDLALVQLLGRAFLAFRRVHLAWAVDAYYLLQGTPTLNWDAFAATVAGAHLALPFTPLLNFLASALDAPVPATVLATLHRAAARTTSAEQAAMLASLRRAGYGGYRVMLARAQNPRERLLIVRASAATRLHRRDLTR